MDSRRATGILDHSDGVVLHVRVHPRGKRDAIVGTLGDCLKISLRSPPVDGKANAALCRFLAKALGVSKSAVVILRGEKAREKHVLVRGVDSRRAAAALLPE